MLAAFFLFIESAKRDSEFAPYFATLPEIPMNVYSFTDEEVDLCREVDATLELDTRLARQFVEESYGNVSRCID